MAGIFEPALSELSDLGIFGPVSFQDYLKRHNLNFTKITQPTILFLIMYILFLEKKLHRKWA